MTNTSGAVVSLTRRLGQLESELKGCPAKLAALVVHFDAARHVSDLPLLLGVANHPIFQQVSPRTMPVWAVIKYLGKIMYSLDLDRRFSDMRSAAKYHERENTGQKKRQRKVVEEAYEADAPRLTESLVFRRAYMDHLRQCIAESKQGEGPDAFYTCPAICGESQVVDLSSAMNVGPPAFASEGVVDDGLQLDPDKEAQTHVCFRVVKANPSQWHIVSMSAAAGSRIDQGDMIIAQVDGRLTSGTSVVVSAPMHCNSKAVVMKDMFGLPLPVLEEGLCQWKRAPQVAVCLDPNLGLSVQDTSLQSALEALVFGQADSQTPADSENLPCVEARANQHGVFLQLKDAGLVEQLALPGRGCPAFRLLPQAVRRVSLTFKLREPKVVSRIRKPELPLQDRTTYELLCLLRESGWQWRAPRKTGCAAPWA